MCMVVTWTMCKSRRRKTWKVEFLQGNVALAHIMAVNLLLLATNPIKTSVNYRQVIGHCYLHHRESLQEMWTISVKIMYQWISKLFTQQETTAIPSNSMYLLILYYEITLSIVQYVKMIVLMRTRIRINNAVWKMYWLAVLFLKMHCIGALTEHSVCSEPSRSAHLTFPSSQNCTIRTFHPDQHNLFRNLKKICPTAKMRQQANAEMSEHVN